MTADLKRGHRFLSNTIADPLTAPEAARMAESIRAVFNTNAQALRFLPDEGEPFSIRDWITDEKKPGSILFVTSNYVDLPMNRALLTLWMDLAINRLMTLPRTRSLRTWFMFDELGAAGIQGRVNAECIDEFLGADRREAGHRRDATRIGDR